jgi:type I restriction enzyme S subunit
MDARDFASRVSRTGGRNATTGVIPGRFALSVGMPGLPGPGGWRWTPLTEVAQLESGHTPSRRHPEYWDGGIPWIGIRDAVDNHGRTIHDTVQHVAQLGLENSSARLLPAQTVCLSRTASVGYVVIMGRPMATSQDFVNWVCGPGLEPAYLKYVLLAENDSLLRFASGTTHQTIYFPEAKAFHALLPPVEEQRRVLQVLAPLDDQIELNRRMNETLEALARAQFQSWFVDFDPVRKNAEGAAPVGMTAATAALFPSTFQKSEIGEIPHGWRVGSIYEVATVRYGAPFSSKLFNTAGHGLPLIRIRDLATHNPDVFTAEEHPAATQVHAGDLVVGMDGEFRAHVWRGPVSWLNQRVCKFVPVAGVSLSFLLYSIEKPLAYFERAKTGTTVIHLGKADIDTVRVLIPPPAVMECFGAATENLVHLIVSNAAESRSLGELRDSLLPKLLSGDLRVREAERIMDRAV